MLKGVFKSSGVVVVAHYAGLTVAQMQVCASRHGRRVLR